MANVMFLHNLRSDTIAAAYRKRLRPRGYLIPPDTTSHPLADRAADLRGVRRLVDNGNFDLIGKLARDFESRAKILYDDMMRIQRRLGRSPGTLDIPRSVRIAYQRLAGDIRAAAQAAQALSTDLPTRQLALGATHLVGVEDVTLAVWLRLSIEEEYVHYPSSFYRSLNGAVARAFQAVMRQLPDELRDNYYPVASALSYDGAMQAGRVFARAGARAVAMGFGAYMADDNYRDFLFVRGRKLRLPSLLPNRYVRTVAAAMGFWDGYRAEAGCAPVAFHFLGLGAPIMIPIIALCAWGTRDLTFDATSPIKDSAEGFLYVDKPAYLKLRTRNIAFALASGKRASWGCPCGFCRSFTQTHPFRVDLARRWFARKQPSKVSEDDLQPGGSLYRALPLLSEPSGGPMRQEVSFTRMGHNHWVLERVFHSLRTHSGGLKQLRSHVERIVDAYVNTTNSEQCARAIRWIADFVASTRC